MKASVKSKTVKRVVLTSSAAAVSINTLNGTGLVVDEGDWTDIEFLNTQKPPTWVNPTKIVLLPSLNAHEAYSILCIVLIEQVSSNK